MAINVCELAPLLALRPVPILHCNYYCKTMPSNIICSHWDRKKQPHETYNSNISKRYFNLLHLFLIANFPQSSLSSSVVKSMEVIT